MVFGNATIFSVNELLGLPKDRLVDRFLVLLKIQLL